MKAVIARATLVGVFVLGGSGAAWANGDCGINSNKPCPPGKSSAKEPAYKSLNSNKPAAQRADSPPTRTNVQASESGETAAKATLSGVNPNDLKIKPKPTSTFEKEPATKP